LNLKVDKDKDEKISLEEWKSQKNILPRMYNKLANMILGMVNPPVASMFHVQDQHAQVFSDRDGQMT